MGPGARRLKGMSGPGPTRCIQAQCFDQLIRHCVACNLLRTPEPRAASPPSGPTSFLPSARRPPSPSPRPPAGASSQVPGTALQPQESVGVVASEVGLPLPGLLFGAPVVLGLALALALVLMALVSWRWQQRRTLEAPEGSQEEHLDNVYVPSPGTPDASAPEPREHLATTSPSHSVPVPATELGSTELVTTKTAGPEQQ